MLSAANANSLFFPVMAKNFPVTLAKIPCSVAQGISLKRMEIAGKFDLEKRRKGGFGPSSL
jgi:hypothetical protein